MPPTTGRPLELGGVTAQALLEGAPDALIIVDGHGTVLLANSQATVLFGYPREELLGSNVDRLVPDAVRSRHADHRQRYMAEPKVRPMGAALDLRARRRDGTEIPVEISLSPLAIEGSARMVIAAIRDITDRRRLEKERQENRDRQRELEHLRQVDQFKTAFLTTAAHELRTPLLPVKSQMYLLKRRLAGADPETRQGVEVLDRNIARLASLVEDLLDAARYQAGRIKLAVAPVDPLRLAQEAIGSFRQAAADRGIALGLEASGAGAIRGDGDRLTQVLYNLLGNAVKFTPDGGRILLACHVGPEGFTASVTDTGIGLSAEDIARLFQPFAQLQESVVPGQRGSGLGLYISRGFVEAHGGRIWAESAGSGKGSTFAFTVPADPPRAEGTGPAGPKGTAGPAGAAAPEGTAPTTGGSPAAG